MSKIQQLIIILIVAFATMITRFLPFTVFPSNKETPSYIYKVSRQGFAGSRTWTSSCIFT